LKIRFQLQVESYISDWRFSESQHLARYVSRHNAMAYDRVAGKEEGKGGKAMALATRVAGEQMATATKKAMAM
jgi:hypothetical protein